MRAVRAWLGAWSLAAVALAGCGGSDNPFSPTISNVAGTYNATSFTATSTELGTINLLSAGATVRGFRYHADLRGFAATGRSASASVRSGSTTI